MDRSFDFIYNSLQFLFQSHLKIIPDSFKNYSSNLYLIMTSMEEFSLSHLKHASLGQRIKDEMIIDEFYPLSTTIDLPEWTSHDIDINKAHEFAEAKVQQCTNTWLCNKNICEKYYVHDTHTEITFLGNEFKPDFMVTTQQDFPYGEFYVSFFIDVKSGTNHPITAENVGQAAVYCTRLLELSAPQRRHASCLVTNLYEAVIVRVERGGERGKWIYRKVVQDAKTAIFTMFNVDRVTLGCIGRTIPIKINNQKIT